MLVLTKSVSALGTPSFNSVLRAEVEALGSDALPLHRGMSQGSQISGSNFQVMVTGVTEDSRCVVVTIGVFFTSVIAGCSCADDPTPVDELSEYCEFTLEIDKSSAATQVTLLE